MVVLNIAEPGKPLSTEANSRLILVFEGRQFPMLLSRVVNNCYMILNVNEVHRLHYVCFQNNSGQVNIWLCISFSVNANAHTTTVRIYGEPNAHPFCTVDIFWEYHPRSNNITHCYDTSRVRAWFNHSASVIDFYQMSLSQSEWKHNIL